LPAEAAAAVGSANFKAPSSANASALSWSQITIAWADNSQNETGFEVQRSTTGPAGTFIPIAATTANAASYNDPGLMPVTQYCYRIRALRSSAGNTAYSAFSNTTCATTPAVPTPPASASDVKVVATISSGVTVSWTDNSSNEDGFRISRYDGSSWQLVATVAPNVTSLLTTQAGYYEVVAFNAYGVSQPWIAYGPVAGAYGATATESLGASAVVTWFDLAPDEAGFRIYRSADGIAGWSLVATVAANTTSWVANQQVCYRVAAFNAAAEAPPSNVGCTMPAAATNAGITETQPGVFKLTWTDNSSIEDGYQVIQIVNRWACSGPACNAGGSDPQWVEAVVATLPPNSTSFSPVPNLTVVDSFTECECIYVVPTKSWSVGLAAVVGQRAEGVSHPVMARATARRRPAPSSERR
jgi:titin